MLKYLLTVALPVVITGTAPAQTEKSAEALYDAGVSLKNNKKYSEALNNFKQAIVKKPKYFDALFNAGWVSNKLYKYNDALGYLKKASDISPNEAAVYLEMGYANDKLNKFIEAENLYKKSISLNKNNPMAYRHLAYLYIDSKKYSDALEFFDKYIGYDDGITDHDVFYSKGFCENELGRYNEAIASLKKATRLNSESVNSYNELGYASYMLENADDAIMYYNKALEINDRSATALNGMADVYRRLKKNIPEAINRYLKAADADPKNKKALYWLGWCYNDLGKYNEAVPYLKKVIEIDNKYLSAYTELGYADYALKNYDDALAGFKKSMDIEKTEINVYYTGLCYVGKKQKAAAQKIVQELQRMNSKYAKSLQDRIDKL